MPRIPLTEAEDLRADHAATFCASCTASADEGSKYCHHCRTYWEDVDAGIFDLPHSEED